MILGITWSTDKAEQASPVWPPESVVRLMITYTQVAFIRWKQATEDELLQVGGFGTLLPNFKEKLRDLRGR